MVNIKNLKVGDIIQHFLGRKYIVKKITKCFVTIGDIKDGLKPNYCDEKLHRNKLGSYTIVKS